MSRDYLNIPASFEPLETRSLFSDSPFPVLASLENPANTVVRIETSLGDIDIELFDGASPQGVASFLARITRGDIDPSFFHRLDRGNTLEAGGYKLDDAAGVFEIPEPGTPAIETARSNTTRTIALGGGAGGSASGTRFFFNLSNNASEFDGVRTVIGRIATDSSWRVVQRIAGVGTSDMDQELSSLEGHRFDSVPVIQTDDDGDHDDDSRGRHRHGRRGHGCEDGRGGHVSVIDIVNIEVIKAANQREFYANLVMYSEGFSGSTVDEFVPVTNPGDTDAAYQVILRFEKDPANPFSRRDVVISTGVIAAHSRGGLDVWHGARDFPGRPDALITAGRPYAIEIRSTRVLGATLSHYDFGTATGESFTSSGATISVLTGGEKGDSFDFLVWYNSTDQDATVCVTLVPEGGDPLDPIVVTTPAYRRGGFDVSRVDALPAGRFAARITSTKPLIAALSHYKPGAAPEGSTALSATGRASSLGVIPVASFGPTGDDTVTLSFLSGDPANGTCGDDDHNGSCDDDDRGDSWRCQYDRNGRRHANRAPAVIDLSIDFEDPDLTDLTLPGVLSLDAGHSASVRLDSSVLDISRYLGERFTVRWTASRPVYGGMAQSDAFDGVSTSVAVSAARTHVFGEGFMDPGRAGTELFETLAIYNPYASSTGVRVVVRYTDGFVLTLNRTADARRTLYMDLHELDEILTQGRDHQRYFYSLEVVADRAVATEFMHLDTNLGRPGNAAGGFATLSTVCGEAIRLDCI